MPRRSDESAEAGIGEFGSPQPLLLAFLGAYVLDGDHPHIPARIMIDVLGDLGVSESATRTTLNRMLRTGLLDRVQTGRTAAFGITARAEGLLREGAQRVSSAEPFIHTGENWTILSYSMPETRRDLRHHLRSQLLWAGFGRLRDGLWIAPGEVDVREILADIKASDAFAVAFAGKSIGGADPSEFARIAWDLEAIESQHNQFIERWHDRDRSPVNPVAAYTALMADWLQLLRHDPGLPATCLPPGWPAATSIRVYNRAMTEYADAAKDMLNRMIVSGSGRR